MLRLKRFCLILFINFDILRLTRFYNLVKKENLIKLRDIDLQTRERERLLFFNINFFICLYHVMLSFVLKKRFLFLLCLERKKEKNYIAIFLAYVMPLFPKKCADKNKRKKRDTGIRQEP